MAKNRIREALPGFADEAPGLVPPLALGEPNDEAPEPPAAPEPAGILAPEMPIWSVSLLANTPLREPTMEIRAASEAEARRIFMDRNGICDTRCEWQIRRAG